jgi:hypothetical protein
LKLILTSFLLTLALKTFAGSCCGGGAGVTQLMLGTTKAVFRASYANQTILADSNEGALIRGRSDSQVESIKTINSSMNYRTGYFSQVGFALPIIEKTKNINNEWTSEQGTGDLSLNSAYEFLPEFNRGQLISQGFIFGQVTLPTAPSLFTSQDINFLDTRGQGHYLYSTGVLLRKGIGFHDLAFNAMVTYRAPGSFKGGLLTENRTLTKSSLDHLLSLTHTYNFTNSFSSSLIISRSYIDNKASSVFIGKNQSSLVYQSSMGAIYSTENYDFIATYQDDFLIGPSFNHIMGKTLSVGLIKRLSL